MVEALRLGADLRKDCEVVNVVFSESPHVVLLNGDKVYADVIVGADGEAVCPVYTCLLG